MTEYVTKIAVARWAESHPQDSIMDPSDNPSAGGINLHGRCAITEVQSGGLAPLIPIEVVLPGQQVPVWRGESDRQ